MYSLASSMKSSNCARSPYAFTARKKQSIIKKASFRVSVSCPEGRWTFRADLVPGYKEFSHIPTTRLTPSDPLFGPALERMKISTRQYAKRQLKWIQKQLLPVIKQALDQGRADGQEEQSVWVYVVRGGDEDVALGDEILQRQTLVFLCRVVADCLPS